VLSTVTSVLVAALGVHALLKFVFFALPYRKRRAAPPFVSPIKSMSYAIQDSPWRPWRELLTLTVLIGWSLVLLVWPSPSGFESAAQQSRLTW
jgi:hypothetical protein